MAEIKQEVVRIMDLKIGIGKYDITGPCAELGFLGFFDFKQTGLGIHSRLFSRAFVIEDLSNGRSVAIVCADMAFCSQPIHQAVIKRLKDRFGNLYTEKNVLISGTHTHSGPGGYSHYLIYNLSMYGFNKQNFICIVEGIFQSIVRAHYSKVKGKILIKTADVGDCGNNRSPDAYSKNPPEERDQYPTPEDKEMTLIKFVKENDGPMGSLNWFAVHPTNMGQENRLISGDNKGYAEELFEKDNGVISAFANSCSGDISPNKKYGRPDGEHDFERTIEFGKKQYDKAVDLFDHATEELQGNLDYRQTYVDMSHCVISGTNNKNRTWPAAFGLSVTAGSSEDSSGLPIWPEGMTKEEIEHDPKLVRKALSRFLPFFFGRLLPFFFGIKYPYPLDQEYIAGHAKKPIIMAVGLARIKGIPLVPSIMPLQLIKLGSLVIIAHPGEMTTMAGRRLRKRVLDILRGSGVEHAVVAACSGAYSSYTTTSEEYGEQDYEGASTLFGPWTLDAYLQENEKLAKAIRDSSCVDPGPEPPDVSHSLISSLWPGVWFDHKPWNLKFGDVNKQVRSSYQAGEKVEVSFYGAHPKNNLRVEDTYLKVEDFSSGQWKTAYTDKDFCTYFRWKRKGLAKSIITIEWNIPRNQSKGKYRIRYFGDRKSLWTGKIHPFVGVSKEFAVG
jgi:neutral ceramidase